MGRPNIRKSKIVRIDMEVWNRLINQKPLIKEYSKITPKRVSEIIEVNANIATEFYEKKKKKGNVLDDIW